MTSPLPHSLRCESLYNPIGIDVVHPLFSWILEHGERGQYQKAYQIIVSSDIDLIHRNKGDVWDSGKVESDQTVNIVYRGKPLQSGCRYYWRVRWWDNSDKASSFSEVVFFEMGLLYQHDWQAKWISKKTCKEFRTKESDMLGEELQPYIHTHCVYLRKEFALKKSVQKARAYICGLGFYELRINGRKIGDHVLDPAQTDYHKRALYATYDITEYIENNNAIAVLLGNGRHIKSYGYGNPRLIFQLNIEYEDGKKEVIASDDTWKAAQGPLMENGIYFGEKYDARLEMPGWDYPDFDDKEWEEAVVVEGAELSSQGIQPIRVTRSMLPQKLYNPEPGIYIYDFGQNFSGWVRLFVQGPRGTEVQLRFAELIHEDGTLNPSTNQSAEATDIYILRGDGVEIYEPTFTYHGFRYVEVTGFPGVPTLENIQGCFIHSDVPKVGDFHCSNELINKIHRNIIWGQLSNLMSVPTDCPQRDERLGWMGDVHLAAEESMYNFDLATFYTKFLKDIQMAQGEEGGLPDIVPMYIKRLYPADPAWGSAYITLAWYCYLFYEDIHLLEKHYESMKRYIRFLQKNADGYILKRLGKYGDWCPPGSIVPKKTPIELTSTWFFYHDVYLMSKIAFVLNIQDDHNHFKNLSEEIKDAFNRAFLQDEQYFAHRLSPVDRFPSQTSNSLPLYLKMVPKEQENKIVNTLLETIMTDHDFHLDTGIIGTRYILDVLTEQGYGEWAYKIATQKSYPSWGYMIEQGATTLWERWENITGGGMNSHNHIMLGSVDAWFYRTIAGISLLSAGWKKFKIKPHIFSDLTFAAATIHTVRGKIHVSWQKKKGLLKLTVIIPVNCEAELYIPLIVKEGVIKEHEKTLMEKGQKTDNKVDGISFLKNGSDYIVLRVKSGYYSFSSEKS